MTTDSRFRTTAVKCVVWDLDDTLWRGTLLEGGAQELTDGVRDVIVELDARGILQAVASKNDHEPAWRRLEELGMAEYFVLARIGWGPKSVSVREIADTLDFALDTIAFVDDSPAERAEVAYHHAAVRCLDASEVPDLPGRDEFRPVTRTADSARRRALYRARFRREAARTEFPGPDAEFLRTLELDLGVVRATRVDLARVEELTLRTSQMNATGVHYPEESLAALVDDPANEVLVATLDDRFGSHGAIGVVLLAATPSAWHLKLLATSCRVVSFGVGAVILDRLADQAAVAGVHLLADLRRTERNRMMEIAYRFAGFDDEECGCRTGIAGEGVDGVRRLHLRPVPRPVPSTMRVCVPRLFATAAAT